MTEGGAVPLHPMVYVGQRYGCHAYRLTDASMVMLLEQPGLRIAEVYDKNSAGEPQKLSECTEWYPARSGEWAQYPPQAGHPQLRGHILSGAQFLDGPWVVFGQEADPAAATPLAMVHAYTASLGTKADAEKANLAPEHATQILRALDLLACAMIRPWHPATRRAYERAALLLKQAGAKDTVLTEEERYPHG